jgi:GntR family transcriptional regulator, histidine utilization repressor
MAGKWSPGFRLPSEHEFTRQFNCARATVNKAMSALAEAGLIERRRKAGSFVAFPHLHSAVFDVPDIGAQIAATTGAYHFEVLEIQTNVEAGERNIWEGAEVHNLRSIEGIHNGKDGAFGYERRLINIDSVPEAKHADFIHESPGAWLLRHIPWSSARHRISAISADRKIALKLARRSGIPCLQIERWTWRMNSPITYVRQIFPGDRFDLVESFTPHNARIRDK